VVQIRANLVGDVRKIVDVLRRPRYFLLCTISAVVAFTAYSVLLNSDLFLYTIGQADIGLFIDLIPLWTTGIMSTVSTTGAIILFVTVALIGVNAALAVFRLVELSEFGMEGAGSIGGVALATLAPACPACATTIFAFAGLSSLFAVLPFKGTEIKVLAVIFLAGSAMYTARQIDREVCRLCQI